MWWMKPWAKDKEPLSKQIEGQLSENLHVEKDPHICHQQKVQKTKVQESTSLARICCTNHSDSEFTSTCSQDKDSGSKWGLISNLKMLMARVDLDTEGCISTSSKNRNYIKSIQDGTNLLVTFPGCTWSAPLLVVWVQRSYQGSLPVNLRVGSSWLTGIGGLHPMSHQSH